MRSIRTFSRRACVRARPGSPLRLLQKRESHACKEKVPASVSNSMIDEAITLLFAGQDTSAATLSWTLHLLSLHPKVQQKLAYEIRDIVSAYHSPEECPGNCEITKEMTSQMKYLNAIIKESMRLYPVAPFIVRKLSREVSLPDTEVVLPKNSLACIWIYGLHHNPSLWSKPEEFLPERWIDPSYLQKDKGQRSGAFMPYSMGSRNCLGQVLAGVVLRIMLARIINKYVVVDSRVERCETNDSSNDDLRMDMQVGFTVLPKGGVNLVFRTR